MNSEEDQSLICELNDRQRLFCLYVVTGHPANEAYALAGYASGSDEAARANASRLITNDNVKAYLDELIKKAETDAVMTLQEKREYLARVVRTPIGAVDQFSDLCHKHKTKVVSGPSVEGGQVVLESQVEMPDKLRALAEDSKLAFHYPTHEKDELFDGIFGGPL